MSVLKQKRTTSKAEFINTANQIYIETINFLTRLSARYSRLIAEPVAKLAGEVIDHAEKANSIYPSDSQRIELRKAHLLEARASLMALDVRKCCNGVRWKQSVQNFEAHLFSGTAKRRKNVLDQAWKPMKCTHFTLRERGKVRPIDAPHITDRQIHKVLCNEVLVPLYNPCMIYDNGASQRNKGLHWHFRRLKEQLHWHFRRYGREGAVLLLDLKGFFPNAPHALLYQRHQEFIPNPDLRALADMVIQTSPCPTPGRGLPLGVEPSQQEMVAMPSAIDNWIKCQAGVHCFGHYMDDYYLILPDVEALKKLGHEIVRRFEAAGIRVNKRKCKIIPLTKPFRFCKARFTLTETGKIKVNGSRDGVKRARRKLKLFHREFVEGKRLFSDIEQYMECQSAYYRNFNDHGRLLKLRRLYHAIFFGGAKCSESSKMGQALA